MQIDTALAWENRLTGLLWSLGRNIPFYRHSRRLIPNHGHTVDGCSVPDACTHSNSCGNPKTLTIVGRRGRTTMPPT